jgi:hypothetical protein
MFLLEMVEIPTLKLVRNLTLYVSLKMIFPSFFTLSWKGKYFCDIDTNFSGVFSRKALIEASEELSKLSWTTPLPFRIYFVIFIYRELETIYLDSFCVCLCGRIGNCLSSLIEFSNSLSQNRFRSPQKLFQINLFMKIYLSQIWNSFQLFILFLPSNDVSIDNSRDHLYLSCWTMLSRAAHIDWYCLRWTQKGAPSLW